jgi:hypothetical protein
MTSVNTIQYIRREITLNLLGTISCLLAGVLFFTYKNDGFVAMSKMKKNTNISTLKNICFKNHFFTNTPLNGDEDDVFNFSRDDDVVDRVSYGFVCGVLPSTDGSDDKSFLISLINL